MWDTMKRDRYTVLFILLLAVILYLILFNNATDDALEKETLEIGDLPFAALPYEDRRINLTEDRRRWEEYCNPVETISYGEEGVSAPGYKLIKVLAVTRHGERAPLNNKFPQFTDGLSCDVASYVKGGQHVPNRHLAEKYLSMMRGTNFTHLHGSISSYPDTLTCAPGMLSARGALQHLGIGDLFHQAYIRRNPLIWSEQHVQVYTSYSLRTRQSALALLTGLFQHQNTTSYDHTPVSNVQLCGNTHSVISCPCYLNTVKLAKAGKLETHNIPDTTDIQVVHDLVAEAQRLWESVSVKVSSVWGVPPSEIPSKRALNAFLMATLCNTGKLTCNQGDCLKTDTIEELFDIYEADDKRRDLVPKFKSVAYLDAVPVLLDIINKVRTETAPRFTLYSAHDQTLTPLLVSLGLKVAKFPPYAARLVFEIYDKESELYLKLLYNGVDRTGDVFPGHKDRDTLFSFKQLEEVTSEILQTLSVQGFMDECNWMR